MNELPPNNLGPSTWYNHLYEKMKQINVHRRCFFWNKVKFHILKIGAWNLYGWTLWYDVSNKWIFNKIAWFFGGVPPFLNIRQIFSGFWLWVGSNKWKEFYIFRISIKSKYLLTYLLVLVAGVRRFRLARHSGFLWPLWTRFYDLLPIALRTGATGPTIYVQIS